MINKTPKKISPSMTRRSTFFRSKRERGATLVELAISLPIFLFLLFILFDLLLFGCDVLSTKYVVSRAARDIATGTYDIETAKNHVLTLSRQYIISRSVRNALNNNNISICAVGNGKPCGWKNEEEGSKYGETEPEGQALPEMGYPVSIVLRTSYKFTGFHWLTGRVVPIQAEDIVRIEPK
ncbi:MAG: hypothetical protein ACOX2O_08060 [Bdellovibrionota bacterium]|jgi:hypothetical protein